ncbi:HK97 gp10 family phage protein [Mycolicibacterium sp. CH28]|uniref:HK97 gp10 family phage protein n=1 Tax=Mycolicibacterium sp. CH28 TaxID=2512237 RepID=UPI0010816A8E|nr:HK97 gp10 family phage protein [Mycolicibacterium sp. CH28]TGD85140.1 HK97 gp10 family phage protein [Mycolicibacterium sp. CH28]
MTSDSAAEIVREIKRAIEIQGEPELRRELRKVAEEVKEYAIAESPYDPTDEPPHYRDQWTARLRTLKGRLPSARVENKSPIAHLVEDGTSEFERPQGGSNPAAHVAARTAFHFGGTVDGVAEDEP